MRTQIDRKTARELLQAGQRMYYESGQFHGLAYRCYVIGDCFVTSAVGAALVRYFKLWGQHDEKGLYYQFGPENDPKFGMEEA